MRGGPPSRRRGGQGRSEVSALGLAALAVAQAELARGVRGGLPGWGRFRSPDIDAYMVLVGLKPHAGQTQEGWPWCAAAVHWCFEQAIADLDPPGDLPNRCPRTAGAIHLWDTSPVAVRTQLPAPGDVFVLDKGKGRGHVGFVLSASPDGQSITSVEPDTNASGSTTGDSWGEHFWKPSDGARGRLLGYLDLG